jgi:predicted RNA-binding Zn-ribbon protein involved in translation (DUF1610 family)
MMIEDDEEAFVLECPNCEGRSVRTEIVSEPFDYGIGPNPVRLLATVPLRTCENCGFQYTDRVWEAARHEAVCRHLEAMTPREAGDRGQTDPPDAAGKGELSS